MKNEQLLKYGFVIPTREYGGGVLGGFGFGAFFMTVILSPKHHVTIPWVWFLAFVCIAVGSLMARAAQRKRFEKDRTDEKSAAPRSS